MEKNNKANVSEEQKKSVWTFFTLLFPSLLMCISIGFERSLEISIFVIALFIYQAILLKNFIEKYYGTE